jgi:hypothetical protein
LWNYIPQIKDDFRKRIYYIDYGLVKFDVLYALYSNVSRCSFIILQAQFLNIFFKVIV